MALIGHLVPWHLHGARAPCPLLPASVAQEDILDLQTEQVGDAEGERERGVIFAGLDRVDALARNAELGGEIALVPVAFRPQDFEPVLHARSQLIQRATPIVMAKTGMTTQAGT